MNVHDLCLLAEFEQVASPNEYIVDEFLSTEMTALGWAVYFGYNTANCQAILTHAARHGANPLLKMKQGFFQDQTCRDIAEYFGRHKLAEQLESMETGYRRTHSPPPTASNASFQIVTTGADLDPNTFAENELEMLAYLGMCNIPLEDQAPLCTALMSTRYCSLGLLKQATFNELVAMELGEVYATQICANQYLITLGENGEGSLKRRTSRAVSFNALPAVSEDGDEEEDLRLAIAGLTKYILARGGNVRGCREKRDFEERAMELDAQSELRTRYQLDEYLQQAGKLGSSMQETGIKGLLSLTLMDKTERALLHYPALVPVLYMAAKAGDGARVKYLAVKAIFNLSVDKRNLKEMFDFQDLVNLLIEQTTEGETIQIQAAALGTLANIANSPHTQREMFQCEGFVDLLMDTIQQAESDEAMRESALDCINNLAINSDNQVDLALQFGMIELLVELGAKSTSANLRETALSCLHNLAFAKDNQLVLYQHPSGVVNCLLGNARKANVQSMEIKQAALGALGNLALMEDNRVAMFAHSGLLPSLCQSCGEQDHALLAYRALFLLSKSPALRKPFVTNFQVYGLLKKAKTHPSKNIALFAVMSLGNLKGSEENLEASNLWTQQDIKLLINALKRTIRGANTGWDLSDVLLCLEQLCAVPVHRRALYSFERDFLTQFCLAIESKRDEPSTVSAINCLTQFTFDNPESIEWIRTYHETITQTLGQIPPEWSEAKYSAEALQFRLSGSSPVTSTRVQSNKVTVVYHSKNVSTARNLANQIKAAGFEVWLDAPTGGGATGFFDSLLQASKTSHCVLVIASKAFKESAPSRVEFFAVSTSQRRVVPCLVDRDYEDEFLHDGWLGQALSIQTATQAYYPLFQDFAKTVDLLMERELQQLEGGPLSPKAGGGLRLSTQFNSLVLPSPKNSPMGTNSPQLRGAWVSPKFGSSRTMAQFTKPHVPDGEDEIRLWLQDVPDGEEIAYKIIKEGLVYSEDLQALARETTSEIKRLVPSLNSAQILRLKEMLSVLFPDTIRGSYGA